MSKLITFIMLLLTLNANAQVIFQAPPRGFFPEVEAAICFIKSEGQVLFLKRQYNKPEGNTWGIPGGKLDAGETAKKAVIREVFEETGIQLEDGQVRYFGKIYAKGAANNAILYVFETTLKKPEQVTINCKEHQDYTWTDPTRLS